MKPNKYYKLLEYIIREYKVGEKFLPAEIEEKAGMKYITVNKYLNKLLNTYPNCLNKDTKRSPYEFTLLHRNLLIESLIKDIIPEFLERFIIIRINSEEE